MEKLSQETINELHNILNKIENEIGNVFEINLVQLDKKYDFFPSLLTVGSSINSNVSIEIYDAIPEYKDLECVYNNLNTNKNNTFYITIIETILHQKYNEERFSSVHLFNEYGTTYRAGICKKCNKHEQFGEYNDPSIVHSPYNPSYDECQACGILWNDCKYYSLSVNYDDLLIYNNYKEVIAKFRVKRQNSICNNSSNEIVDNDPLTIII